MGRKLTHEEFEEKALKEHGSDRYLYLSEYTRRCDIIRVYCLTCNISFLQLANAHLQGKGCSDCAKRNKTKTNNQFILDVEEKYPNRFKILSEYTGCFCKIKVKCLICNIVEYKEASNFLETGCCRNCGQLIANIKNTKTHKQFILDLQEAQPNKFKVLSNYISSKDKILVKCLSCSKDIFTTPNILLSGSGCYDCNIVGNYTESLFEARPDLKDNPATLYFYKFKGINHIEEFYKIGITINKRSFEIGKHYKIILSNNLETTLYDAFQKEQKFIIDFKEYKYTPKIKFGGYTECFSKEIYNVMFNN